MHLACRLRFDPIYKPRWYWLICSWLQLKIIQNEKQGGTAEGHHYHTPRETHTHNVLLVTFTLQMQLLIDYILSACHFRWSLIIWCCYWINSTVVNSQVRSLSEHWIAVSDFFIFDSWIRYVMNMTKYYISCSFIMLLPGSLQMTYVMQQQLLHHLVVITAATNECIFVSTWFLHR